MKRLAKKQTGGVKPVLDTAAPKIKPKTYKNLEEKGKYLQKIESDRSAAEKFMKGKAPSYLPKVAKKGGPTKAKKK
jgi:hypothetical protein